ncbi:plasmid partitioning protein RepB [Ensifer soli]|uniref:plasmid partitioning protein RepB n=1 Tax=Ciceribacter sp. sgz301302 TaxID=3342379 RepID=UPI0035B6E120
MARKNLLTGLAESADAPAAAYPMRGASKTMVRSIGELARQAEQLLEGETIVELDPTTIEASFVSDRMGEDAEGIADLRQAIEEHGQTSPVLVRPHPDGSGRYQAVFGHRRIRVAAALGRPVRAVIKTMDDRAHVIAQGQENSARADLSFVERALFAARLDALGYDRSVILSALATHAASLSKMLTIVARIPADVILAIGPAPSIGRERWMELSLLAGRPANAEVLKALMSEPGFAARESDARFTAALEALKTPGRPVRKQAPAGTQWLPADGRVEGRIKAAAGRFTLSLSARDGHAFGRFLSDHLDEFYALFREGKDDRDSGRPPGNPVPPDRSGG